MKRKALTTLKAYCTKQGIKVKKGHKVLLDFAGMNEYAAKKFGYPKRLCGKKTILLDEKLPIYKQVKNLRHEIKERKLMKAGDPYWKAHVIATRDEKHKLRGIG
jgi:hypothetical protein